MIVSLGLIFSVSKEGIMNFSIYNIDNVYIFVVLGALFTTFYTLLILLITYFISVLINWRKSCTLLSLALTSLLLDKLINCIFVLIGDLPFNEGITISFLPFIIAMTTLWLHGIIVGAISIFLFNINTTNFTSISP